MKKLMSILGTMSVLTSSVATVVACGDSRDLIQIVISEDPNAFWTDYIKGAEDYVKTDELKDKYRVKWISSKQDSSIELSNTKSAVDGGAKAIILAQVDMKATEAAKYVNANNVPLIASNVPFADEKDLVDSEKPNWQVFQDGAKATAQLAEDIYQILEDYGVAKTNDKYKVYEIQGNPATTSATTRHAGWHSTNLFDNDWMGSMNESSLPDGVGVNGMFLEIQANQKVVANLQQIVAEDGADLIYAHSDAMARGALSALQTDQKGKDWLQPEIDEVTGEVTKLGGIIVGYDYDTISVTMLSNWKQNPTNNIFATVHMSASELGSKSVEKAIEEIENSNENKSKYKLDEITITVKAALDKKED
ncbi:sugar ABC transporter substrate-binding protein [Spiroplasma clarkii]|uniref:Ribose ABC transporter substrate-binding protein n=1 Tax=Spiroplasma clarkii TaxID=2139 RepID=A0A2K8KJD2_9MOLU|nr:lipoprotein [Spiroplasma clarkii]ATX70449.1 ribose ABC transporter substrate-binding protein [Spiroplasma clarkii]